LDGLGRTLGTRPEAACVAVADTTRALGDIAARHRRHCAAGVVAITGSNGKTSTRRMTAAVLARRFAVLEPARNLNNRIGVPLTLFRLEPRHQWAVLELGTSMPGEIARLAEISRPDVAVVTNVGPAHLEGLGSLEGVAAEKGALVTGLAPGGRAVLNADDPRVVAMAAGLGGDALMFGLAGSAGVRAAAIRETPAGIEFDLLVGGAGPRVRLEAFGRVMVHNALAAAAVGTLLGLPPEEIRAGLESFRPVPGRMGLTALPNGVHLIDDTYNANPASMRAAVETLAALHGAGRALLVTGDMRELGPGAARLHRELGRLAAEARIDRLFVCGGHAAEVAAGAIAAGMPAAAIAAGSRDEIGDALLDVVRPGDWVLVKGSRTMGMETIVRALGAPERG
ncbi:MAG TPA: UDP-N-acetylmuramoyl-tripeptide--D-alanyl-D-alanine ligase, partial [Desulfobacterales bacterium]|nr:UDP-N-acetylmuramoyl-tripeptide--D-alanyl-D-alanine ligase [Desulfobacterales bacterium]